MDAAPSESDVGWDRYRFRLTRRLPRVLKTHARRSLRALRSLAKTVPLPEDSLAEKLSRIRIRPWRRVLIPGARAGTLLDIAGRFHAPRASLSAPEWDPRRREITVVQSDPNGEFRGRVEVSFQLEFADETFQGQSAIALLGAALREIELVIDRSEAARHAGTPGQARRHETDDASRDQNV